MIQGRINTVRRAAVHIQNKRSEGTLVPKNKPCKRNNRQISDNTKIAAKQGNAEEQPDAGCEKKRWKAAAEMSSFFNIPPDISKADKPREFEGRALNSHQAANLSSKKIANCEYASPQSRTGMVHFLAISLTLI